MAVDTITGAYEKTARMDLPAIASVLVEALGPTLVAYLAGAKDRKLPAKWADGTVKSTRSEPRLRDAHRAWVMVSESDGPTVARAWFIGSNPHLGEISPVEALRAGRVPDVIGAARHFVTSE